MSEFATPIKREALKQMNSNITPSSVRVAKMSPSHTPACPQWKSAGCFAAVPPVPLFNETPVSEVTVASHGRDIWDDEIVRCTALSPCDTPQSRMPRPVQPLAAEFERMSPPPSN